jgi:hypothetical protein
MPSGPPNPNGFSRSGLLVAAQRLKPRKFGATGDTPEGMS